MLRIFEDQKFASQTFSRLGIARTSSVLHSAYRKRSPIFNAPSLRPPFIRNRSLTQSFSRLGRTRTSSALHLAYRKCSCRGFLLTHVYYIEMQFTAAPLRRTQLARGSFRPPPSANIWLTRVNYIYKCSSQNCAGRASARGGPILFANAHTRATAGCDPNIDALFIKQALRLRAVRRRSTAADCNSHEGSRSPPPSANSRTFGFSNGIISFL